MVDEREQRVMAEGLPPGRGRVFDDRLGSSVSLTDLSGYARADIAIGEDAGNGTILQIDNTSTSGIKPDTGLFYGSPTGIRIGLTLAP
ncbi:hypothetical protein P6B95_28380 [Streptomyces atratus]|uniref:hypothetical protein n=1 Tax=Streptomyces atratus TaxID=1893 RepID=UPI002AC32B47|nr:hypothetical protein [Streptomyces atratus]WPW30910.1 hypothetical protein P6B95_28380 [Streptomyces atratus]